ncbi:MAG: hypothetical protein ABF290_01640, partial [Thiogranum sp.]
RQFAAPARYQRPVPPPAFNPRAVMQHPAARLAQYRPLTPAPAPMWAGAAQPLPSSPADTDKLQAQKGASDDRVNAGDTAELAAFESSPLDTSTLSAQNGASDDLGQAGASAGLVEEPVADVPPLLARPTWMNGVSDGS